MTYNEKQRITQICESVVEDFLYGTLEESTSEKEILYTKKLLKEATSKINELLTEAGFFDYGKNMILEEAGYLARAGQYIKNNPGKVAAGVVGAAGAGLAGYEGVKHWDDISTAYQGGIPGAIQGAAREGSVDGLTQGYQGGVLNAMSQFGHDVKNDVSSAYDAAANKAHDLYNNAVIGTDKYLINAAGTAFADPEKAALMGAAPVAGAAAAGAGLGYYMGKRKK